MTTQTNQTTGAAPRRRSVPPALLLVHAALVAVVATVYILITRDGGPGGVNIGGGMAFLTLLPFGLPWSLLVWAVKDDGLLVVAAVGNVILHGVLFHRRSPLTLALAGLLVAVPVVTAPVVVQQTREAAAPLRAEARAVVAAVWEDPVTEDPHCRFCVPAELSVDARHPAVSGAAERSLLDETAAPLLARGYAADGDWTCTPPGGGHPCDRRWTRPGYIVFAHVDLRPGHDAQLRMEVMRS